MPQFNPSAGFAAGMQQHDLQMDRIKRMGLSARQMELNRLWSFYYTEQYASRTVSWDGRKVLTEIERDSIARTTVLPQGFYDAGGKLDDVPLDMRKPTAPYHLVRVVVNRFTGLLFSDEMHPQIRVAGDPMLQTWIEGLIKSARLWIRMAHARTLGGAMGSVAVTYRFKAGKPVIEIHDPRWTTPTMTDRSTGEVSAIQIRYMYPAEAYDPSGKLVEQWFWYRRVIDQNSDVTYAPAPVGDGDEPAWVIKEQVNHQLGEFPGVWIRNSQTDEQDGEPDCHGCYPIQEAIDRLLSQADQGAVENCDPTLLLESDDLKLAELRKGSRNAIKTEKGGGGQYLEISGSGIDSALKVVEVHRRNFLEVVQCILDVEGKEGTAMATATEINRRTRSMHERGALFREQYGEMGVKVLIAKIIRAALRLRSSGPTDPATGLRQVGQVMLPPMRATPTAEPVARSLPAGLTQFDDDCVELMWPDWVKRGPVDAQAAAGAVATARTGQVLDQKSAVEYLAPFFGIDDPAQALAQLQGEGSALDASLQSSVLAPRMPPAGGGGAAPHAPPPQPHELGAPAIGHGNEQADKAPPPPPPNPNHSKPPTPGVKA